MVNQLLGLFLLYKENRGLPGSIRRGANLHVWLEVDLLQDDLNIFTFRFHL